MKKVAVLVDGWNKYVNYAWMKGCQEYIEEYGLKVNLYVFHSFGNFSKDEKFNFGEYNIYNLPDLTQFDGIIMELTNVSNPALKERVIRRVRESNVPAVSMVEHVPGVYYVGIDNFLAMERLVEHLVSVHGAKTLNYVGGPIGSDENQIRLKAYKDVLTRHGIPVEEERIFHSSYDVYAGEKGFDYFQKKGLLPDAFVCANDNLAVGVIHRAAEKGYKVPDDFMVTGFDNFDKAAFYNPRITTVGFTREKVAYQAMYAIDKMWNKVTIKNSSHYSEVEWEFQESCGCTCQHPRSRGEHIAEMIFAEEFENKLQNELLELKRDLVEANDFHELADCVEKRFEYFKCASIYMIVNSDIIRGEDFSKISAKDTTKFISQGYPEDMEVLVACDKDGLMKNCRLENGELFPGEKKEKDNNLYLFLPLHFRDQEVGYMVFKNCHYLLDTQQVFEIITVFQEAMEHLYQRIVLKRMNEELEKLYIMDSLTGLYNRMAYSHIAEPLFDKCKESKTPLAVLFADVDRLKYINDNFGHDAGNVAIKNLALAIAHCTPDDTVAIRYGGDEFVILIPNVTREMVDDMLEKIHGMVQKTSEALNVGFTISASIGYTVIKDYEMGLNEYINDADESMYRNKAKRKLYIE